MTAEKILPMPPDSLFQILQDLGVAYDLHHHAPIFTVDEGKHLKSSIPGMHCRNLFLRDKKKKMFLVVAANETKIDLKKLSGVLDAGRFSFGSAERLWAHLRILQGSVNPFCIMNDKSQDVRIILDQYMMTQDIVNYHPMDNAMTIGLSPSDLLRFLESANHTPEIVDLSLAAPDQ